MILNAVAQDILDKIGDSPIKSMLIIGSFGEGDEVRAVFGEYKEVKKILYSAIKEIPEIRDFLIYAVNKYLSEQN